MRKLYKASCDCGSLNYYLETSLAPSDWPVRACDCSFCAAREHVYCGFPDGSVHFDFASPEIVERYSFATNTADFLICKNCGAYMGAVMEDEEGGYAILNIKRLVDVIEYPNPELFSFEGELVDDRLSRRKVRWTPVKKLKGMPPKQLV